jgi:hypothetical protein
MIMVIQKWLVIEKNGGLEIIYMIGNIGRCRNRTRLGVGSGVGIGVGVGVRTCSSSSLELTVFSIVGIPCLVTFLVIAVASASVCLKLLTLFLVSLDAFF